MDWKRILGMTLAAGVVGRAAYLIWRKQLLSHLRNIINSSGATMGNSGEDANDAPSTKGSGYEDSYVYQVLIYPDKKRACKYFFWGNGCQRENCLFSHEENSMSIFLSHILSAQRTLDVCVYVITDTDLVDFVLRMRAKGVLVRVITNVEAPNYTGTQIGRFRANGIQVRTNRVYLMHHKFLLIDKKKILSGSFNWTSHASTANNENMIITDNPAIVQPFVHEFDRLWKDFGHSVA
ncbi:uncharacterized protein [Diadema antillarum]|uniref:uncharacterized protein n=1 Tax=Diadema antillarum TaxID=105358 RepID=UPI003A873CB2